MTLRASHRRGGLWPVEHSGCGALRRPLLALAVALATVSTAGCVGPSQESRQALQRARKLIPSTGTRLDALSPAELRRLAAVLQIVVRSGQGGAPAASNLGLVLESLEDEVGAALAYSRALDLDPAHRVALDRGAVLDARAGRWDRAAPRLLTLYQARGGDRSVAARLATALAMAGRHEEGTALARRLLQEKPSDPLAMAALAAAELAAGRPGVAEVLAEKARQADEKTALAHAVLAGVALQRADHGGTAAWLQAALEAQPGSPALTLALCDLLLAAGSYARAEEVLRELSRQQPHRARLRVRLGLAMIGQARAEDAERVLTEAKAMGAVEALYGLGLVRHRLQGRKQEALALYREFIDRGRPPGGHPVYQELQWAKEGPPPRGRERGSTGSND